MGGGSAPPSFSQKDTAQKSFVIFHTGEKKKSSKKKTEVVEESKKSARKRWEGRELKKKSAIVNHVMGCNAIWLINLLC